MLFVVVERRSPAPLRIVASRSLVGGNLVIVIAGIAVDGLLIVVTLYSQQVLGFSAMQFGLTIAEHDAGLAAGLEETSFAVGTTVGAALASAVAIGYATHGATAAPSAAALIEGFGLALLVLAAVAALGALLVMALLRPAPARKTATGTR